MNGLSIYEHVTNLTAYITIVAPFRFQRKSRRHAQTGNATAAKHASHPAGWINPQRFHVPAKLFCPIPRIRACSKDSLYGFGVSQASLMYDAPVHIVPVVGIKLVMGILCNNVDVDNPDDMIVESI